jgi:hypothetical protein
MCVLRLRLTDFCSRIADGRVCEASGFMMMFVGVRLMHRSRHNHPFIKLVGVVTIVASMVASG